MPEDAHSGRARALRPFWSGTVTFGLVNVPVQLFVANRNAGTVLHLVDSEGAPLKRRYVCRAEGRELQSEEIVRGHELRKSEYVIVDDDELDALAPEKSREIVLDRFVPIDDIDPIFFDRAYFLAPDRETVRAYRLLARVMEDSGRAGIATFVMRGKEYLIAILAERGLLRAETLRFRDEIRTPAAIGLPELKKGRTQRRRALGEEIARLESETLDRELLVDPYQERLRELVEAKLESDRDVVAVPEDAGVEASARLVDLMQALKQSLDGSNRDGDARKGPGRARAADRRSRDRESLSARTKPELYARAKKLNITGRSNMSKDELIDAIENI